MAGESDSGQTAGICHEKTLGDFRILHELGRGGMGIVYAAEQLSLGRRVALKVMPMLAMLDEQRLRRFRNEAHAAALLQHPHIVSVFYVGCERGLHFYVMPLIDGASLHDVIASSGRERACRDTPDKVADPQRSTVPVADLDTAGSTSRPQWTRRVVELAVQAARAPAFAHREGVIHRDIKPSNLLLRDP